MKVCVLLQSDFPPDPRLSRTARALMAQGHQVELFCDNRTARPTEEIIEGIRVFRVKNALVRARGLGRVLRLPIFWNPIWVVQFLAFVARGHFGVIHAINLTMIPLGLLAGRLFRIPVIYDMYENYPDAIRSWRLRGLFNRIFKNATAAEVLDRFCLRTVDHILVVTEEAEERARHLGARQQRISVVHNTPDLNTLLAYPIAEEIIQRYQPNFTVIYTGQISPERGLETAIKAMPIISRQIPKARLVIVGGGPSEPSLQELTKNKGVRACVEFAGWVDPKLLPSFIAAANVCIVPHPANPFIDTTIPNKLFEYMALGKPVVASDAKPLARVVTECQCGEIFKSRSPEDFANAVLRVHRSTINYGENGRQAVINKYNWGKSSQELLRLYEEIRRK